MEQENPVERACRLAGINQSELARRCGVSRQALDKWAIEVPAKRVRQIVSVSGGVVNPHDLRPDLYPEGFQFPPEEAATSPITYHPSPVTDSEEPPPSKIVGPVEEGDRPSPQDSPDGLSACSGAGVLSKAVA